MNEANNEHEPNHETPTRDEPKIYVASLSDYNAGRLHGVWIDATQEPDDIHAATHDMLAQSIDPLAEEWAIHDYDGFGPVHLNEYESFDTVSTIARGITEHGAAFAHWAAHHGTTEPDLLTAFEDHYLGHWDSMEAFAEELTADFGIDHILDQIPVPWRYYVRFDVETFARDLSADYLVAEDNRGVHLFDLE